MADNEKGKDASTKEGFESLKIALRKRRFRIIAITCAIPVVLCATFFILIPAFEVSTQVKKFRGNELGQRMAALRWLVKNLDEKRGLEFAFEALLSPYSDENIQAYEIIAKKLKQPLDPHIKDRLIAIWQNKKNPLASREHALFLLSEFGDKSLEPLFLSTEVWFEGKAWDAGWRYLKRAADERTVEELLAMLRSGDVMKQRAAAFAVRPIKQKPFVKENRQLKEALLSLLKEPVLQLREEAMETLWEIADPSDEEQIVTAMTDKLQSAYLRTYGARALGRIKAKNQTDLLVSLLSDPDGGVVDAAARALKEIGEPSVIPKVAEKALSSESDSIVRKSCINVLSAFNTPESKSALVQMLYIDDAQLSNQLVDALWRLADEGVVNGVALAMKRSPNPHMRAMSILLLGWLRRTELIDDIARSALTDAENLASNAASAFLYILDEKALNAGTKIFLSEDAPLEARVAMTQVLAFYKTFDSLKYLAIGIGHDIERLREGCCFGLKKVCSSILNSLDETRKQKIDELSLVERIVETNTKKRLIEGFEKFKNDGMNKYELLLDSIKNLPSELSSDRQLLWNAVSVLLERYQNERLIEWFTKERKLSRDDIKNLFRRLDEALGEFSTSAVDGYKKNKELSKKLLTILGVEK
jgi:HEAT repeat protein